MQIEKDNASKSHWSLIWCWDLINTPISSVGQRCHSCNTTETPEWRRGPDGARTLCNACGLRMILYSLLTMIAP